MRPTQPKLTFVGLVGTVVAILLAAGLVLPPTKAGPDQAGRRRSKEQSAQTADASHLLQWAIGRLQTHRSISARVFQQIDLVGFRSVGTGRYVAVRPNRGPLYRMEINIPFGRQISRYLEVCDGRRLWLYETVGEEVTLKLVDLQRVREKLEEQGIKGDLEGIGSIEQLGGLVGLLRHLNRSFRFQLAEAGRLYGVPVWKLSGRLKRDRLARYVGSDSGAGQGGREACSGCVPQQAVIHLGQDDGFPYLIEYHGHSSAAGQGRGDGVVRILFHEVQLDGPVPPTAFAFDAGQLEPVDVTDRYLKDLTRTQ